jgi:CheY-like chemotaxis protein
VDNDNDFREVMQTGLECHGFQVVAASSVDEALGRISSEKFDVLISDLHMPEACDGFTVFSVMRRKQPEALTLLLGGYSALQEAASAIVAQADEVLAKPIDLKEISEIIQTKLAKQWTRKAITRERVATIMERNINQIIQDWISKVDRTGELMGIPLNHQQRSGHLPLLLGDLVRRLRLPPNSSLPFSRAARTHGLLRRNQAYTAAMIVEESRILQVSIFNTLQNNLRSVDFNTVLLDVMTIADEVDLQLKQAMIGFSTPPCIGW